MIVPVVLCGGSGSRLWPLSRRLYPKQFHNLHSDRSLLQETADRAGQVCAGGELIVVTNEDQKFLVADQLDSLAGLKIVIEPVPRNTAPAIGLAAFWTLASHPDAVLLVMPADHLITDAGAFGRVVAAADRWARQGKMVTFGIRPTAPETGYGYIEQGRAADSEKDAFLVQRFVEKPDAGSARSFIETNRYFWNSGIFMFGAQSYLDALRQLAPEVYDGCKRAMTDPVISAGTIAARAEGFASCPDISVDYAVMEKTNEALVVPFEGAWSDIGSWGGLADALGSQRKDVSRGQDEGPEKDNISVGDVYTQDVGNSYIHAGARLVAAIGIKDLIVVETDDAVLVAGKGNDQKVKAIVEQLRQEERKEVEHHSRVFRPWGSYQTLELQQGFQVKRLIIKPGASISLQLHHRRSEHWVVVKGEALVTRGEEHFSLGPNESTYIPRETRHKLQNNGDRDLEIIEVQTGDYLGEDDIVRFEDKYGRV